MQIHRVISNPCNIKIGVQQGDELTKCFFYFTLVAADIVVNGKKKEEAQQRGL